MFLVTEMETESWDRIHRGKLFFKLNFFQLNFRAFVQNYALCNLCFRQMNSLKITMILNLNASFWLQTQTHWPRSSMLWWGLAEGGRHCFDVMLMVLQYRVPVYPQDCLHWIWPYLRVVVQTHFWKGKEIDIFMKFSLRSFNHHFLQKCNTSWKMQKGTSPTHPIPKLQLFYENFFFLVDQGPCIKNHFGPNKILQKMAQGNCQI